MYNLVSLSAKNKKWRKQKMKRKLVMIMASAMLMAMLTACGSSGDTGANNTTDAGSAQTAQQETPKADAAPVSEGDLGDYHVKILDAETGLNDYDGNPVIGVKYEYTNNGDENMMFEAAVNAQAFQDGVQLDPAFMGDFSAEYENSSKEIKTGTTLTCELYYVLTSDSDVEVEVTELISLDNAKLVKKFTATK